MTHSTFANFRIRTMRSLLLLVVPAAFVLYTASGCDQPAATPTATVVIPTSIVPTVGIIGTAGPTNSVEDTPTGEPTVTPVPATITPSAGMPRPDHVVVVMEENHAYSEIIGAPQAPYINALAESGALFTNAHGVEHPSQPNYLDLFSGSNHGILSDACPNTITAPNLARSLLDSGLTFVGYSEGILAPGSDVCSAGNYKRKHNPWVNFTNVPRAGNQPFTAFPSDFSKLPTVSFVVPNQQHDMHDGTIAQADTWLKDNLAGYVEWARLHNSLLVVAWDEDDNSASNQIPLFFVGPMVVQGQYSLPINHFNTLRTLEDMYGLPYAGASSTHGPILGVWSISGVPPASLPAR